MHAPLFKLRNKTIATAAPWRQEASRELPITNKKEVFMLFNKVLIQETPTYQLYVEHSVDKATGLHCLELTTVYPTMRNPVPHRVALLHMTEAQMQKLALTSAPALVVVLERAAQFLKFTKEDDEDIEPLIEDIEMLLQQLK
jgi:hypothetical protein